MLGPHTPWRKVPEDREKLAQESQEQAFRAPARQESYPGMGGSYTEESRSRGLVGIAFGKDIRGRALAYLASVLCARHSSRPQNDRYALIWSSEPPSILRRAVSHHAPPKPMMVRDGRSKSLTGSV
jgi:hypothetical protein